MMKLLFVYVVAGLLRLAGPADAAGNAAVVHPMVPMFHRWDYEKSVERIARAAETGARRVSFTVLLLSELEAGFKVRNFGAVWPRKKDDGAVEYVFQPMTPAMRQEIGAALRTAFAEAVKRGLEINVLPQIDASGAITEWRNFFDFDPTVKCGEFSYESAMLETILESMEAVVPAGHPVEMTLEGEMGCSLFTYPDKWRIVLERLRARGKLTKLRLGISANYEGVTGKVKPDAAQQEGMKRLIAASDFIGLSCYAKVSVPPVPDDFMKCVETFAQEFAEAGSPIPPDKPLRWTELGHGGGGFDADWKLKVPGPMLERLGNAAFFGTDKPEQDPWKDDARVNFRRQFYTAALEFLTMQSAPWKVEAAYLWSYGSWDVHGIHGTAFGDETIAAAIRLHNEAVGSKK